MLKDEIVNEVQGITYHCHTFIKRNQNRILDPMTEDPDSEIPGEQSNRWPYPRFAVRSVIRNGSKEANDT